MQILTGEQMRRIDRYAIDRLGIPSLDLMEAAGRGVAEALLADYGAQRDFVVLCGKGNNGGDGLVAARHLVRQGVVPRVVVVGAAEQLSGDAAANYRSAVALGIEFRHVVEPSHWAEVESWLTDEVVVLDALLGTGVRGGARGTVAQAIEGLTRSGASVVALDLPSGLDADRPEFAGTTVLAQRTYTLCRPKLPLVLDPGASCAGRMTVIPIGIPESALDSECSNLEWLDREALSGLLSPRSAAAHKGSYGHLLAVAGSRDKSGAAVLLGRAALRCGVGLVTVATPASAQQRVALQQAELMTEGLAETIDGVLDSTSAPRILELAAGRSALALGPGIGTSAAAGDAVREVLARIHVPTVIDADALNALAPLGGPPGPDTSRMVLTPHPGEAGRLLGRPIPDVQADRLGAAKQLAATTEAVVVLKGHRSLIACPDGRVSVCSSGNPGMATAGTGDALTGTIGALLARGLEPRDAARLGTWVHGVAGDRAAARIGQEGLIASDLIEELPQALTSTVAACGDEESA